MHDVQEKAASATATLPFESLRWVLSSLVIFNKFFATRKLYKWNGCIAKYSFAAAADAVFHVNSNADIQMAMSVSQLSQPLTWHRAYVFAWMSVLLPPFHWNRMKFALLSRAPTHGCTLHKHTTLFWTNEDKIKSTQFCHRLCNAMRDCDANECVLTLVFRSFAVKPPGAFVNCSLRNRFNFELEWRIRRAKTTRRRRHKIKHRL